MFTVVTAERPSARGLFRKRVRVSCCPPEKRSALFMLVRLYGRGDLLWRKAQKVVGNSQGRVLLAEGMLPPPNFEFLPPHMTRYSRELMKTGLGLLLFQEAGCRKKLPGTAVLVDLNCRHQEFADILVGYFQTVRIVTNRGEAYRGYVGTKLTECGAAVIVTSVPPGPHGAALYVSPDGVLFSSMKGVATLLPEQPEHLPEEIPAYHTFSAPLPAEYGDLLPKGVNERAFSAALYGCCGKTELGAAEPDSLYFGEMRYEIGKIHIFSYQGNS